MSNLTTATDFLNTLNQAHSVVSFTMETQKDGMLLFLGTQLLNRPPQIETKVYVKPTIIPVYFSTTIVMLTTVRA